MELQGSKPWNELRCTTWNRLQVADVNIVAGLLACVFIHSQEWRKLYFHCKGMNQSNQLNVCTFEGMRQWFSVEHVPRKWAEQLVCSTVGVMNIDFLMSCVTGHETVLQASK